MSTTNNVDNIVVNVDFQRRDRSVIFANEVQVVPGDIAWEDLELMLKIYSGYEHVKVSYADDDNDLIVIESEEELQESFKVARKCNNTLKLTVTCENQIGTLDLERELSVVPPDGFHLLEMSPGRVLYRCGVRSDELWMAPRGANIDDRLDCHGEVEVQRTAIVEPVIDSFTRKSFFIVNKRCPSMVLDVEGGGMHPGARVIVWYRKRAIEGIMNQLWYKDSRTATIRTHLNDFCLDVVDGRLVVNPCDLNSIGQKWAIFGNRIQNVFNHKWVIGLNKDELSACDEVLGLAEEELTNTEWIVDDPESEFSGNMICGNLFFSSDSCSNGVGHPSIVAVCDICDRVITGVRYKCGFCHDFDLCASCESKEGVHDPTHLLLKMSVSQDQIQLKLSALEPVLMSGASGCVVGDPRQQITTEMPEKSPQNDEQPIQQIMNDGVEVVQRNPLSITAENQPQIQHCDEIIPEKEKSCQAINKRLSMEPDNEEVEDVVIRSNNDERSLVNDLLDAKFNQLKMTSSALTVPSDTPIADAYPQTPMVLELNEKQSLPEGHGVHGVPSSCEENLDHVNMAIMADLVHKKMSDIVADGEFEYVDVERASSSSSSTSDFYVVPIPDCFNPNLPARKEASTTVIVKKSAVRGNCLLRSVEGMLSTSSYLATEALLSPRSCFSVISIDDETTNNLPEPKHPQLNEAFFEIKSLDIQQDIGASGGENAEETSFEISEGAAVPELEIWQTEAEDYIDDDAAAAFSCENSGLNEIINKNEAKLQLLNEVQDVQQQQEVQQFQQVLQQQQQEVLPQQQEVLQQEVQQQQEVLQQEVVSDENQVETERTADEDAAYSASRVESSTLQIVSSVFSFVAKAAKDVFTTLQDKNSYIPPRSNWTPTQNQWTPTTSSWTPQPPAWSPTIMPQWNPAPVPEDTPFPPAADFRSLMDQLIEMGFADRQLNHQLLQSCGNNIDMVIQKLVEMNGNIR